VFVSQFQEEGCRDFFATILAIPTNQSQLSLAVSSVAARKLGYTIVVIMPINRRLMNTPPDATTAETRRNRAVGHS
jgi:hypothetical protein